MLTTERPAGHSVPKWVRKVTSIATVCLLLAGILVWLSVNLEYAPQNPPSGTVQQAEGLYDREELAGWLMGMTRAEVVWMIGRPRRAHETPSYEYWVYYDPPSLDYWANRRDAHMTVRFREDVVSEVEF